MNSISDWKESASMALTQGGIVGSEFSFEVTSEQKEYLEGHLEELDGWCNQNIEMIPTTVKFEPFQNGTEDAYTCDCYFD